MTPSAVFSLRGRPQPLGDRANLRLTIQKIFCNKICHLRTDAPQRRFKTTTPSNPENLRVACLNLLAHPFDRHSILLHDLDLAERLAAGLLLGLQVLRTHAAMIDDELLRFRGEAE